MVAKLMFKMDDAYYIRTKLALFRLIVGFNSSSGGAGGGGHYRLVERSASEVRRLVGHWFDTPTIFSYFEKFLSKNDFHF